VTVEDAQRWEAKYHEAASMARARSEQLSKAESQLRSLTEENERLKGEIQRVAHLVYYPPEGPTPYDQLSTQAEELERLRGSLEMVRSRVLLADEQLMNNLIPNGWLAVSVAVHEAALALQPPTQQGEP
jgi:hypothetical protein